MSKFFRLIFAALVAIVGVALGPVNHAQAMNVTSILYEPTPGARASGIVFSHPDRVACLVEVTEKETSCQFEMFYKNAYQGSGTFMNFEVLDQNSKEIGYAFMSLSSSDEWQKTTVYITFASSELPLLTLTGKDMYDKAFRPDVNNKPVVVYHQWPDSEWETYDSQTPFFSEGQFDIEASGFDIEGGRYSFYIEVKGAITPKTWTGSNRASILIDLNGDEIAEYSISTPSKALKVGYGTAASLINKKTGKAMAQKNCDADAWLSDKNTFAFSFLTKCVNMPLKFGYQAQVYDSTFRGLDVCPDWGLGEVHRNFGSDVTAAYAPIVAAAPVLEATAIVQVKKLSTSKVQLTVSNLVGHGKILIQRNWSDIASITAADSADAALTLVNGVPAWVKVVTLTKGNNIIVVYQDDDRVAKYEFKY